MINRLFINNKDAWLTWGVTLRKGSYDSLRLGAPQKEYISNDSLAQHGKQYFTQQSRVDEKQVILMFYLDASSELEYYQRSKAFEAELRKGLLLFRVPKLFTEYKLILNNFNDLTTWNKGSKAVFSARFTEPNPTDRESTLITARILTDDQQIGFTDNDNEILTEDIRG